MGRLRVKWEGNTEEDSKGGIIGRIWQGVIQKRPVIQEERGRGSQLQTMSLLRNRIKHRRPPVAWCYLTNQVLLQSTSTSNSMLPSLFTNSFNHRLSLRKTRLSNSGYNPLIRFHLGQLRCQHPKHQSPSQRQH